MTNLISSADVPGRVFFLLSVLLLLTSVLFVGPHFVLAQLSSPNNLPSPKMGVKITSLKENQTVPLGELTIYGTSSDTPDTDCQVYVDWNDLKPMQNVTGIGPGGINDYSNWTFTYTQNYHLIIEGTNELTSKISCYGGASINNITTKYYSINITGSDNLASSNIPTASGSYSPDNSPASFHSIRSHSILPQYSGSATITNESKNDSESGLPKSNVYIGISSKYSVGNDTNGHKRDNEIIEFRTLSSLLSSVSEKDQHDNINFDVKWKKGMFNPLGLNKYIHDLIREKLDKISEKLID